MFVVCKTGSFAAFVTAIYSDFAVDRAIVSCTVDFQQIGPPVNINTLPVMNLLQSRSPV